MKELPGTGGFRVPDDLDGASIDVVRARVAIYSETAPVPWRAFAAAWNGLAHRYRAADEFNRQFVRAMAAGDGPPPEERYDQEVSLFGFAFCALSAIECLAFAIYCLGSLAAPQAFPTNSDNDLQFYPKKVREAFLKTYPNERLGGVLGTVLESVEYKRLADLRNVLSHRGTLPRSFYLSVGANPGVKTGGYIPSNPKSISSAWLFDQPMEAALTQTLRDWLGSTVSLLLESTAQFAVTHLASAKPPSNER